MEVKGSMTGFTYHRKGRNSVVETVYLLHILFLICHFRCFQSKLKKIVFKQVDGNVPCVCLRGRETLPLPLARREKALSHLKGMHV